MIVLDISKGSLAGVQHKKQEAESSRPGIIDIKTLRQVNYVRGVAYQVSGFFGGHASTLTATSHLDRHSCTITGESSSQWQRSTARLRPLGKWLQGALLFRFLLQSLLGPIPRPHGLAVPWAPRSLCRSKNRDTPVRGMEPLPRLMALSELVSASFYAELFIITPRHRDSCLAPCGVVQCPGAGFWCSAVSYVALFWCCAVFSS